MKEKITPHLRSLINKNNISIKLQFKKPRRKIRKIRFKEEDPLSEEILYSPIKGLVHKFENRVLWKMSYFCAANCQSCTRIRQIGTRRGDLTKEDIRKCALYIKNHKEIDDVILSGGDPFYTPKTTLLALEELQKIDTVKVIRIGTKMPIHAPDSFKTNLLKILMKKIKLISRKIPIFILINVSHHEELTKKTLRVIELLRKTGAILMSQTVFLKGINDNIETLEKTFKILYFNGIIPYYIYRCDYVAGLERFVVSLKKERHIMTELTKRLSGIACPTYVVDAPNGCGKIPVPLNFFKGIKSRILKDFDGKTIKI